MHKGFLRQWHKGLVLVTIVLSLTSESTAQTQLPPGGHVAKVHGIEMYYEVFGQGSPLVLLHGFTGSSHVWKPYTAEFAKHYRVIVPDLRGHGRSTNPTNQFTHRQSARDVFALLDQLRIDRFKGIGSSSGGMTLIHMATQQAGRVEAMVLIASTIYFPEQARDRMRRTTLEGMPPEALERQRQTHKRGDDQIRALIAQFHAFKDSYDDMNFTPPYLSTIKTRTLIVHGDRDDFFPVSIPVEMYRSIPHSFLWIIPNGGHSLFAGRETAITQTALEFLRGDWEKGSK